jgi:hypothetical protein
MQYPYCALAQMWPPTVQSSTPAQPPPLSPGSFGRGAIGRWKKPAFSLTNAETSETSGKQLRPSQSVGAAD